MTILNRYLGVLSAVAMVSFCLIRVQAQPKTVTDPTDAGLSAAQAPEAQTRALSWGSHESIKACTSCHMHAMESNSESDDPALKSPVPQLCTVCHTTFSNPKGRVHGPVATGECLLCHDPHQATTDSLLKTALPDLCHQCHEPASLELVPNHKEPAFARCEVCHDAHTGPARMLLRPEYTKAQELLAMISDKPIPQIKSVGQNESLQGIDAVQVLAVIDRPERFESYGLTQQKLRNLVESSLGTLGIPVFGQETPTDHTASLLVHLRLVEVPSPQSGQIVALSGSLTLQVHQTVALPPLPGDNTHRTCSATTWDAGSLVVWGTRQCEKGLAEALEVFALQFGQAYKQANPQP